MPKRTGLTAAKKREAVLSLLRRDESAAKISRRYKISEQTLYVWRRKYGQLEAADVRLLRGLQREDERLKKLLAERDLAIDVMKEINGKKW